MEIDYQSIKQYLFSPKHAAPLAVFRILFGILMFISTLRFWYHGWIEKLYITPSYHFHYYGFEWVSVPGQWTYLLFVICGLSALTVAAGYRYRLSIAVFFLSFTYIELMDKTTYLNHYYFITILSFILIWLPAHVYFSVDAAKNPKLASQYVPSWNIDILKLLLAIVYIYAGAAKLNYDWMVDAMPLTIWLPTKFDIPLLGDLSHHKWVHYLFSWGGAVYDLSIVFLLLFSRTRVLAFTFVVIFHLLTRVLFPIGMFPYIMIMAAMIFFSGQFHDRLLTWFTLFTKVDKTQFDNGSIYTNSSAVLSKITLPILTVLMVVQLLLPLRFLTYPDNVFWTEEGYRFSWRVMLMEKTGYANFKIVNGQTGDRFYVTNEDFLSSFQIKQMSTQPDFIIEYAHYLGHHFASQGHENVEVYVESYASLNGRMSQVFIGPDVNLMEVKDGFGHKNFITPIHE